MGRRSKADLMGIIERIVEMYESDKKSVQEIEDVLREEGYDISREAIRRSLKTSKSVARPVYQGCDRGPRAHRYGARQSQHGCGRDHHQPVDQAGVRTSCSPSTVSPSTIPRT